MFVYPNNLINTAIISSVNTVEYSNIDYLKNVFYSQVIDFRMSTAFITFFWPIKQIIDSFVLGNSAPLEYSLVFYDENELEIKTMKSNNIVKGYYSHHFEPIEGVKKIIMSLSFAELEKYWISKLFIGMKMELPRFIVFPEESTDIFGEPQRGEGGGVFGIPSVVLRTVSVEFLRIQKDLFNEYIRLVQYHHPHFIDFYPEAHDDFPPIWGTVNSSLVRAKRSENGFFWNFDFSWKEAT
ncbi:MAG: hypothetical protein FWE02_04450 [Defluviitaleaceae bacterium]|nr:hypothetical protein [Defluviitaleaceae bacterium]